MLVAVSLIFIATCAPYRICVTVNSFFNHLSDDHTTRKWLINSARWLWYFNSAVNPIIYNILSLRFRQGILQLIYSPCDSVIRSGHISAKYSATDMSVLTSSTASRLKMKSSKKKPSTTTASSVHSNETKALQSPSSIGSEAAFDRYQNAVQIKTKERNIWPVPVIYRSHSF